MTALEPRCTHPQGQSNPESLSINRLCKHNRSWGDSPSIASQTGTAFPAPKQGPFPASLTAQTAQGCFGTTNAGTPWQVVPQTETKPWLSQLSSAPLNPMTPIPSQKNAVAMDACFLLLALEEGPPLSARLRGGDGVGDIFPITSTAVKLCTSPSRRRNRPQLSQTNSASEAETPRGMLPEAYCAQGSLLCATPAGPPSRPWFPAGQEFLSGTRTHRKSGHSLGPAPGTAEADRGRAEGTGRHGERGLRGPPR